MSRTRTTWTADRKASAAPATPGYGTEDQGHPAYQPDPAYEEYANGDPSSWAEDPTPAPYPQGNPPADPGYDVEDQDHPAHIDAPRVPKEATMSLKAMVERKANKCIKVARAMLGCGATGEAVEDQALDLMDLSDDSLDAMYARMDAGKKSDFLAGDEETDDVDDEIAALLAEAENEDEVTSADDEIAELEKHLAYLKAAKKAEEEEEEPKAEKPEKGKIPPQFLKNVEKKKEEAADKEDDSKKSAKKAFRQMLACMDTDSDGFVMQDDWTGNPSMFAQLDDDADGILSVDESVNKMFGEVTSDPVMGEDEDDLTPEETAMLAETMYALDQNPPVAAEAPAEVPVAAEEPAEEAPVAMEDSEAGMFSMTDDPMGLNDPMDAETDELLAEIFGGRVAKSKKSEEDESEEESEEDESEEESEEKEAEEEEEPKKEAKKASLKPQRPKASNGAKTLGTQTRVASRQSNELNDLWESAPDVSSVFGVPPTSK